jgi:hypothetical protein
MSNNAGIIHNVSNLQGKFDEYLNNKTSELMPNNTENNMPELLQKPLSKHSIHQKTRLLCP